MLTASVINHFYAMNAPFAAKNIRRLAETAVGGLRACKIFHCTAPAWSIKTGNPPMTPRHLFFRRVVACTGALQMLALFSVSGQVDPPVERRSSVRIEPRLSEGEQALARARAAANRQNVAQAYAEYGTALRLLPRTGPQYAEALRGFSETGVKLAEQRLAEGRASEADRITREVLRANANYRPALNLLSRLQRSVSQRAPGRRRAEVFPRQHDRRHQARLFGHRPPQGLKNRTSRKWRLERRAPLHGPHPKPPKPLHFPESMAGNRRPGTLHQPSPLWLGLHPLGWPQRLGRLLAGRP